MNSASVCSKTSRTIRYGLWEFDWTLNSMGFEPAARVPLLRRFAEQGLVNVFHSNWESIRGGQDPVPLPRQEAVEAVSDHLSWRAPTADDDRYYIFVASAEGEALIERSFAAGKFRISGPGAAGASS